MMAPHREPRLIHAPVGSSLIGLACVLLATATHARPAGVPPGGPIEVSSGTGPTALAISGGASPDVNRSSPLPRADLTALPTVPAGAATPLEPPVPASLILIVTGLIGLQARRRLQRRMLAHAGS